MNTKIFNTTLGIQNVMIAGVGHLCVDYPLSHFLEFGLLGLFIFYLRVDLLSHYNIIFVYKMNTLLERNEVELPIR